MGLVALPNGDYWQNCQIRSQDGIAKAKDLKGPGAPKAPGRVYENAYGCHTEDGSMSAMWLSTPCDENAVESMSSAVFLLPIRPEARAGA